MNLTVEECKKDAIWVSGSLFERGKSSGSTGNISFRVADTIYISCSGSSFASLKSEDFAQVRINKDGSIENVSDKKPSKELPLHWYIYRDDPDIGAVIHTHSFYSTLWSCLKHENELDVIPEYTPYLKMKVGNVGMVPYAHPGSQELFDAFEKCIGKSGAYLLKNHGPVVPGKDIMDAFYKLEELEESARIAWNLRNIPEDQVSRIS